MTDDNDSPFKAQNEEWDALRTMFKAAENMWRVPIVDDYYPEVQHRYMSALGVYLDKLSQRHFGATWAGVQSTIAKSGEAPAEQPASEMREALEELLPIAEAALKHDLKKFTDPTTLEAEGIKNFVEVLQRARAALTEGEAG